MEAGLQETKERVRPRQWGGGGGSVDTGSRSVPVKTNQRVVGGGGSVVGRFIQESPLVPPARHV